MLFKIEPRQLPSVVMRVAAPLIAGVLTLAFGSVLFLLLGKDPLAAFAAFFIAPLSSAQGLSEWLLKASPLVLIGLGLSLGFRANVWNIGAEGQFVIGAIAATGLGLTFPDTRSPLLLPAMVAAGAAGGAAWAAIPAFLRTRFNTSEILVSLMLSYVAGLVLVYLVNGPWRDPEGFNYPQTAMLGPAALFAPLVAGYRLNTSIFITLGAVAAIWVLTARSFLGYKMTVGGIAPAAARYAGFQETEAVWVALLGGGAAAGLAGMMEASGPLGQLSPVISPGYGFAAIIVAFIGRLQAGGIVLGGLLLSLLYAGGEMAQMQMGLPASLARFFQGLLLVFLLASDFFIFYRVRRIRA